MFIVDGQRVDTLGCYGGALARTPNIDALAADGTLFRRSFCSHSVCMPTRASIFTGRYPHIHGVWANGVALPRSEVTLPQVLAGNGYATCASGKVHFEPQQAYDDRLAPIITDLPYYGFQEVHLTENALGKEYLQFVEREFPEHLESARKRGPVPEDVHDLHWTTSQTLAFMESSVQKGHPFFCSCSFHEISPPSRPPAGYTDLVDPADVELPELRESDLERKPPFYRQCYEGYVSKGRQPSEDQLRTAIASAHNQMRFIDKQFGRVIAALERLGILDDTIVLYTADHGLSYNDHYQWRHGPFLFDQVTNVPMLWRVPGMDTKGTVTAELVESVDIMPTVLDLCGVPVPLGVQGCSLAPLLKAEPGARGKESVLLEEREAPDLAARGLAPESVTQIGLRTQDWKLIHYPGCPYGELYDLRNDPGEFNNLWPEPDYRTSRREMESLLMDRLMKAQDPLPERHHDW